MVLEAAAPSGALHAHAEPGPRAPLPAPGTRVC